MSTHKILGRLIPESPYSVYMTLKEQPIEAVLFSMGVTQNQHRKRAISNFLLYTRHVKPILTGEDLKGMSIPPGPIYSTILNRIIEERIKGNINTRDEETVLIGEIISNKTDMP